MIVPDSALSPVTFSWTPPVFRLAPLIVALLRLYLPPDPLIPMLFSVTPLPAPLPKLKEPVDEVEVNEPPSVAPPSSVIALPAVLALQVAPATDTATSP